MIKQHAPTQLEALHALVIQGIQEMVLTVMVIFSLLFIIF